MHTARELRNAHVALLEQPAETLSVLPENYLPFLKTAGFTPEYEHFARHLTNPLGQHNSAYDPEAFRQMPPQDELVKVWGWFHGNTGFSCMFRWKSGRQDAYAILDVPNADETARRKQQAMIQAFKQSIDNFAKEVGHA